MIPIIYGIVCQREILLLYFDYQFLCKYCCYMQLILCSIAYNNQESTFKVLRIVCMSINYDLWNKQNKSCFICYYCFKVVPNYFVDGRLVLIYLKLRGIKIDPECN